MVAFTDSSGRQHTKTMPLGATLEEARSLQTDYRKRKFDGGLVVCRQTVGELLDEWLELRKPSLKPKTIRGYDWAIRIHLKPAFGSLKVTSLTPSEVAQLISKMKKDGLKTWTVRHALKPLQGAYQLAVRDGKVASSPVTKLLPSERPRGDQREMRCLSSSEITLLLSGVSSPRWKTLFALLTFAGLRISEALALTWDDVSEGSVFVRSSKTRAGVREVMLIPTARTMLTALRLSNPPGTSLVFCTHKGTPVDAREALRALQDTCERIGLPRYTLHELRHTFASILIHQREPATLVAKQMGHADPAITMKTYAHLFEEQESVDQARERLQETMGGLA